MTSQDDLEHMRQRIKELETQVATEQMLREQAEEILRVVEDRYRSIVEATPSGICITNEHYLYEYVNPAYCTLYGYHPEELMGKSFTIVVPEENQQFMMDLHDQYIDGATEIQGEWQVVAKDGTVRTILADAARIVGEDGRPRKATFVVDITGRKHAEESLQRRNAYLNALHDVTLGLLNRLEINDLLKAIITRASELVRTEHGFVYLLEPDGQTMHLRLGIGLHAEVTGVQAQKGEGVAGIVWQSGETLVIQDYPSWEERPSKFQSTRLRSVVGVPLTSNNTVIGVIGLAYAEEGRTFGKVELEILEQFAELASIALDNARLYEQVQRELEERKRAEASLRLMDAAVRSATECVLITDANLEGPEGPKIVFVNPAFTILSGYSAEEALGKTPRILQGPKTDRAMLNRLKATLQRGEPFSAETVNYRKDGSEYVVEWRISPIKNEEGDIIHWVSVQHETTERKRNEEALRAARKASEAASHAKSAFLSRMSHELRTPLNAILGFVQVMERDTTLNKKQQENIAVIKRSGNHLLGLINDVLEISKIEAGREMLNEQTFHLPNFLQGIHELFLLRVQQRGITLEIEHANTLPIAVYGDEGKLRQVVMNLISNAIKFTKKGGVTIRVRADSLPDTPVNAPVTLVFEIEDTGQGIAEEELDIIFEAFGQSQSGKTAQEGTGLGLPISREFVKMMGGTMKVHSSLGIGTTFTFDVHMKLAESGSVQAESDMQKVQSLETGQPEYRILIIDDNWENRTALMQIMESVGFSAREATNGQEGIEIWETWQPHLIWMDMRMPVMDGYETIRRIKATPQGQQTCIIAITASAFEHERSEILETGCDDVVIKPFREEILFDKMVQCLGVRFVYGAGAVQTDSDQGSEETEAETLSYESLSALPAELFEELNQAVQTLNMRKASELIARVREYKPAIADELEGFVKQYRFDIILSYMQPPAE